MFGEVRDGFRVAAIWESHNPKDRPWFGCDLRRDEPYAVYSFRGAKTPEDAVAGATALIGTGKYCNV